MTTLLRTLAGRGHMARIVLCGWALALAVLAIAALPQRANAQAFSASKNLCLGTPGYGSNQTNPNTCPLAPIVGSGVPVFYVITVTNPPGQVGQPITLNENPPTGFPTGFVPNATNAVVCTDQAGNPVNVTQTGPGYTYQFALGVNTTVPTAPWTVTCTIAGTFSSPVGGVTNTGTLTNGSGGTPVQTNTVNAYVAATTQIPTDLAVSKSILSVVPASGSLPATVTYRIVVTNLGPQQFDNSGNWFVLHDTLALLPSSVPLQATIGTPQCTSSGGAICPTGAPIPGGGVISSTSPQPLLGWGYSSGTTNTFPVGSSITVTIPVQISQITGLNCIIAPNSDGLNNQAFFTLTNATTHSAATDLNPANNTTPLVPVSVSTGQTQVNPNCGSAQLNIQKTQLSPANNVSWGSTVNYQITISNNNSLPQQTITIASLRDIVSQGLITPPFTSTFVSWSCTPVGSTPATACNGFTGTATSPIAFTTYGQSSTAWSSNSTPQLTLQPGWAVNINISFKYTNTTTCTTASNVNPEPIANTATITYQATPVGSSTGTQTYQQSASVVTDMKPLPPCPLAVTKTLNSGGSPTVAFGGPPLVYTVTFANNNTMAITVGTVMDAVRLTDPAYGTPVPYSGSWSCSTSTGVTTTSTSTGVTGFPASNSVGGSAIYTPLPPQGAPIFQFTNLKFPPNSTLICTVTITVKQPSLNNPNCSATPTYFENLGLMDVTNPYNPNVPWPPSGSTYTTGGSSPPPKETTNWATADAQLPQCYDVIINKTATPPWTTANGPAVKYAITVTNTGTGTTPLTGSAPMGGTWNGLLLTDTFTATPYSTDLINPASCGTWCTLLVPPNGSAPYNPSSAGVKSLAPGASGVWNLTLNPTPYPFVVGQTINNCATVTASAPFIAPGTFTGPGWYANYANPNPPPNPPNPPQKACASVPVLATTALWVFKTVVNNTGAPITPLPALNFTGGASCTPYPLLPRLSSGNWTAAVGPKPIWGPGIPGEVTSTTLPMQEGYVQYVPFDPLGNEKCTVTENPPPPPAVPVGAQQACPGGFAYWGTPTVTPASITIVNVPPNTVPVAGGPNTATVTNKLNCLPTANLIVTKKVVNDTGATVNFPLTTFNANVGCMPNSLVLSGNLSLQVPATPNLLNNGTVSSPPSSTIVVPVAAGESCTVTETTPLPAVPASANAACSPGPVLGSAAWYTTITPTQPITPIVAGTTYAVTITNTLRCQGFLDVRKSVSPDPAGVGSSANFTITVNCTPPAGSGGVTTSNTLNVQGNTTKAPAVTNLMVGSSCTFQETPPTATFIYQGQTCTWQTPTYSQQPLTISMPLNLETVTNTYSCQGQTANLQVIKKVVNATLQTANIPASPALTFTANVSCGPSSLSSPVNLPLKVGATSATTLPPGGSVSSPMSPPVAVPVVPGETCTVTETTPLPAVPSAVPSGGLCQVGNKYPASWTTTIAPPQPITNIAAGGTYTVTMTNTLSCNPLTVKKLIPNDPAGVASGTQFLITATCTPPSAGTSYPVYVYGNTISQAITGLAFASSCSFVETLPPNFTNSSGQTCIWQTPTYSQQPLTIGMGPNTETVTNSYKCQFLPPVKPGACAPPMITGPTRGSCVCPQGMQLRGSECVAVQKACPPPMIPGAAPGSCVCPEGMKLQGKQCVRPIECKPPLIPNAAGRACVCPQGTVRKGLDCVRPIQCRPPMIPNAAATACVCPQGTVQRERECVPIGRGGNSGRDGGRGGAGGAGGRGGGR